MTRISFALAALLMSGCVADPLPVADASGGTGGHLDGMAGTGGVGGSDGEVDPDRGPADAMPDGPELDAEVDQAPPDLGIDAEVDLGMIEEVDPPPFELVAVTRRGSDTFFIWVDAEGQLVSWLVDENGQAPSDPTVLETPEVVPDRVAAQDVDGHPWVAHGAEGLPVVLFQADLYDVTRIELDALFGPPMLVPAGDGVVVIARSAAGDLAWQRVSNELEVEPLIVDEFGLDMPSDAGAVPAGVVLYFSADGQCIQLSDRDWRPTGNFACPTGDGRLISDGRTSLALHIDTFRSDQVVMVKPIYDDDNEFLISYLETEAGLQFADDGNQRPLVGARTFLNNQVRRLALSFVSPIETWDSVETWADVGSWPFAQTRGLARRTLPEREVEVFRCESGLACETDDDCVVGSCDGIMTAEFGLALDFRRDGQPRIRLHPLLRRDVLDPPYRIDPNRGCVPEVERCDLLDQDCDGRADDGLCCEGTADIWYGWTVDAPVATIETEAGRRFEMLVADVERNDAYRIMYRIAGTDWWEGKVIPLTEARDTPRVPSNLNVRFTGAVDGRFLLAGSGFTSLVARQVPEEGGEGGWAVFSGHPTRNEPGEDPPRPVVPLDCDDVLAADVMNPPDAPIELAGQVVVVCTDKIVRIFPVDGTRDTVTLPEDLILGRTWNWATIYRRGVAELQIMIGYSNQGSELVRSVEIDAQDIRGFRTEQNPPPIPDQASPDLEWPIYRHPVPGRAPIQIRSERFARLPFEETDSRGNDVIVWRDLLLAPNPTRTIYSPTAFRVFSAGPVEPDEGYDEATGWWAADIKGDGGVYNLWSTEPVFTIQGPIAHWGTTLGSYGRDNLDVDIGRYDLVVIRPTDDTGRRFEMISRETRCTRP